MKILVIVPPGLGNYLMSQPALYHLADRAEVSVLALKPAVQELAVSSGRFRSVFAWDPDKNGLKGAAMTIKRIRDERFDTLVLLYPTAGWKYALFAIATGIPRRAGFDYPANKWTRLVLHDACPVDTKAHDADQNLWLARHMVGDMWLS